MADQIASTHLSATAACFTTHEIARFLSTLHSVDPSCPRRRASILFLTCAFLQGATIL